MLLNVIQFVKVPEHKVTVKKPKEFFDDSTQHYNVKPQNTSPKYSFSINTGS
jgi:hypothetical protein